MAEKDRRFRVRIGPYKGQVGSLIGKIDYDGCKNGWHTLKMPDGQTAMYAGEELSSVNESSEK